MLSDIFRAEKILKDGGYTCVLLQGERCYTSRERGVKPLISFLESGGNFSGFSAADKTVGAGAAYLYVLLGVTEVWTGVLSESAKKVLDDNGIKTYCERLVPQIINRAGDDVCPIEKAVSAADTPEDALVIIKETLRKLSATPFNI
ncbi:MAG: DUF1893 domain-containing protein [Acutalibacteraceae bacterium]